MEPKEKEQVKPEEKRPDNSMTKIALIVGGVVVVLAVVIMVAILMRSMPAAKADKPVESGSSDLDKISIVSLGRVEVSKANDPMQQSFTRVSVAIDLVVPTEKSAEVGEKVTRLSSIFKESARQAFLDADSRDLAAENVGGVKNAIKTRFNQTLGEEVIKEVVFPEYRAF